MDYFVLVDCNNFYASCERVFNPKIERRPVIVLSNNDGCVVARSQESKQLGIKMGEPLFKIRNLCKAHDVVVFSSNYQLYGDLSQRVMQILTEEAPEIQIYSIDEAFLKYPGNIPQKEIFDHCIAMRQKIKQWVGIPTSLGIAPTKTLAKVANDFAKKEKKHGVFDLTSSEFREAILREYPIGEVWGIGSQLEQKLRALGARTAWEFSQMDPLAIRRKMGVVGERMVWELRGVSCLQMEHAQPNKSISYCRSFGKTIDDFILLSEALSTFVAHACVKLREQKLCAQALCVYAEILVDFQNGLRRGFSNTTGLSAPSNDTPTLINIAKQGLQHMYYSKRPYKKCGVILLDLISEQNVMDDMFLGGIDPKRRRLAETVDALNVRYGKNTLFYAAMGTNPIWKMRSDKRSRHYTTSWDELALVKA